MIQPSRFLRRISACLIALTMLGATPVSADTSTSTQVSVEVIDVGTRRVQFSGEQIVFTTDGGSYPGITTSTGATAYSELTVTVEDTRAAINRAPYSIGLTMGAFQHTDDSSITISSANLSVVGVDGLDEGMSEGATFPAPLSQQVPIVRVDPPPSGLTTITVTVSLHIPAGTVPGSYTGSASLEIIQPGA